MHKGEFIVVEFKKAETMMIVAIRNGKEIGAIYPFFTPSTNDSPYLVVLYKKDSSHKTMDEAK